MGLMQSFRHLQVLLKHRRDVKLDDLEVSKDFLTIFFRSNGLQVSLCFLLCLPFCLGESLCRVMLKCLCSQCPFTAEEQC